MKATSEDRFSNAEAYQSYVGRWSHLVGQQFIDWLNAAPGSTWLDIGAGTGVLTEVILQVASPSKVVAVDLSPEYIDFARQHINDERVDFRIDDAANVAQASAPFDVAVAGLVLNFLPAPEQTVAKMVEAVRADGLIAAYVWDYAGQMEMMRHFWDAAVKVDVAASDMDSGQRFTICHPDNLRALFQSTHLQAVDVVPIDVQTQFKNFDDYWLPFLGAQGSVSKYLHGLNDETRAALHDQLQRQLPIAADGGISLVARAWAVKGQKSLIT